MNDPVFISIVLIIAMTGLFLSIKAFLSIQKVKKEAELNKEDTDDTIRTLRKMVVELQRETNVSETVNDLKTRIDRLERPMRIAASVSADNPGHSFAPKPVTPKIPKDGFFGAPKGDAEAALFNDQYDELRDECFFSVHYLSTTEAEFEPIDLMRLKSLPAIEGVIRYDGCPLKEARGFQLKSKGQVKKQNNYWVVTARAELQMQK
ncbi:MAG: hypothetical protein J6X46_02850 [Prevotella sp.]|nr:hypothetical protein [Prevotella sp.]